MERSLRHRQAKGERVANHPIREVRVESWVQLHELLYEGSYHPQLNRFRSPFAFRGLSRLEEDLRTSLMRLGGETGDIEHHMLRNFRKYAHRDALPPGEDGPWNWLALAQHHGLPTRLLDWTFSPYIALHFVTARRETSTTDGLVWCVNYVDAREELPPPLRQALNDEGSNVFTVDLLNSVSPSLRDLEGLSPGEPFPVFLEPPSLDERIVHQNALFSLMSTVDSSLDQWLRKRPHLARRLIIPAALKWEIRDKLDQAGITERLLFPGLDGLARWLSRYYSPRDCNPNPD